MAAIFQSPALADGALAGLSLWFVFKDWWLNKEQRKHLHQMFSILYFVRCTPKALPDELKHPDTDTNHHISSVFKF